MRLPFLAVAVVPVVAFAKAPLADGEAEVASATQMIVQGDFAGAEPLLRKAVREAPDEPEPHYNLAVVLRSTGRNLEAAAEYHQALDIFESTDAREADVARCLYGIALAQEANGDPRVAVSAWDNYIQFAQRFRAEQPSVAIARMHIDGQMRASKMRGPYPFGPQTASRPSTPPR